MPHVVWGTLSSCIFSAELAFALVVNTNEKTTAATVLMSTFFALKFFVVIVLKFNVYTCYYLCHLFSLISSAKLRRFSSDSKKNLKFFSNLCGQTNNLWTNRRKEPKSCPKGYEKHVSPGAEHFVTSMMGMRHDLAKNPPTNARGFFVSEICTILGSGP